MHKGQKAFKAFGTIRLNIPLFELYKECTICAILRVNTPICLAATEIKICCAMLRRGPIIMQIPRDYQKKMLIAWKVCNFVVKVKMLLDSKNRCGATFVGFGGT